MPPGWHFKAPTKYKSDFTTDLEFNPETFHGVSAKPANTFMHHQSLGYFEWIRTADLMNYHNALLRAVCLVMRRRSLG